MRRLGNRITGELVLPGATLRGLPGTGILRALAFVVCVVGAPPGVAQEAAPPTITSGGGVDYDAARERLSVSVANQPIVSVFEEISARAGLGLVIHGSDHGLISADFHDLPLERGIRRLLAGRNHVIVRDAEGKGQIMVWILSSPAVAADTRRDRHRLAPDRSENRSVQLSAETSAEQHLRNLYPGGGVANALPDLLDDLGDEGDIIRDAIAQGEIPQQLIDALEQESGQ